MCDKMSTRRNYPEPWDPTKWSDDDYCEHYQKKMKHHVIGCKHFEHKETDERKHD